MSQHDRDFVRRIATLTLALVALASWVVPVAAASPKPNTDDAGLRPTIHYEEALAHADDDIEFAPGGRVSVGFTPRSTDHWKVGGVSPRALPAGRLDGRQMRAQSKPPKAAIRKRR